MHMPSGQRVEQSNHLPASEKLEAELRAGGYESTEHRTGTGRVWRSTSNDKHIIVPDSYDGYYPDFILEDIKDYIIDTRRIVDEDGSGT
jgi:hypothetical protein